MDLKSCIILIDKSFIEEIYKLDNYKIWFKKLLNLQNVSIDYQNIMCDKHFSQSTKFKKIDKRLKGEVLLTFVKPVPIIFNTGNEYLDIIKLCIQLSSKKPYKTLIFSSQKIVDIYKDLPDYKNYDSIKEGVKILNTEQALLILDVF